MSNKGNLRVSDKIIHLYARKSVKSVQAKPFLKWAGGKTQLLIELDKRYPIELRFGKIKRYIEPFLGGGAVYFDIVQKYNIEEAFLFDINEELILVFKTIKKDVEAVIDILGQYQKKYIRMNENDRKVFYYKIRKTYNDSRLGINYRRYSENWSSRTAQMIFLNRTCFNGLFRLNRQGEYNVPFGKYENPKILDDNNLVNVSKLLQNAKIESYSFEEITKYTIPNTFIYFDPPFRPISKTASFTSYSKLEFGDKEQIRLAEIYKELDKMGCKLMLSNSDPKNINDKDDFFDELYREFHIERVRASRMINCVGEKRGKINELIITNY